MTALPYLFQLQDVRKVHQLNGRALVSWEMGTGKTFLGWLYIKRHPEVLPVVVVCPASVKWAWKNLGHDLFDLDSEVLEKRTVPADWKPSAPVTIVNYDILTAWLPSLLPLNPNQIIIDEGQMIANQATQRTQAVYGLCEGRQGVLVLTGTPILNHPSELFSVANLLWPTEFPSFFQFALRYCDAKLTPFGWDYSGTSNLDELHERITKLGMLRRLKAEVLDQLPAKTRIVIPIDLDNRAEYNRATKHFEDWLLQKNPDAHRKYLRAGVDLQNKIRHGYLRRLTGELKLKAVKRWLDDWLAENDGKIVVFACHRKILDHLYDLFRIMSVKIDGSVVGKERQEIVDAFQTDPNLRMCFGNMRAAGTAITLTAATVILFVELDDVPGRHAQAENRCHRIGTKENVTIYYLVARNTVEERQCKKLQEKQGIITEVLDSKDDINDLDVFDQLKDSKKRGNQ